MLGCGKVEVEPPYKPVGQKVGLSYSSAPDGWVLNEGKLVSWTAEWITLEDEAGRRTAYSTGLVRWVKESRGIEFVKTKKQSQ